MATLEELDEAALIQILVEPKNALIKQYQKMFRMEGVELEIREAALRAIASKALARKTGARGLRSILEQVLLDVMYDLPSHNNLARVVVDEATIANDGKPLLMFADPPKVASAQKSAVERRRGAPVRRRGRCESSGLDDSRSSVALNRRELPDPGVACTVSRRPHVHPEPCRGSHGH